MTPSTSRDYWVKRQSFPGEVRCVGASGHCRESASFLMGWSFDTKVKGKTRESTQRRPVCEKHARLFAFKKGLQFPKAMV